MEVLPVTGYLFSPTRSQITSILFGTAAAATIDGIVYSEQ